MSLLQVNAALVSAYQASGVGLIPTAYEMKDIVPPASGQWNAVINMPADLNADTLGDDGLNRYMGFLQIDLHEKENAGTAGLLGRADMLISYFRPGRVFTYQTQSVKIRKASPSPIRRAESGFVLSVSVYWDAWMPRV